MDQLLHVGYVKTATSFLQTSVFNNPDLGFGLAAGTENRPLLIQNTVLAPHFEPLPEEAAAQFRAHEACLSGPKKHSWGIQSADVTKASICSHISNHFFPTLVF
jgi:hypothetical protein